MTEHAPSQETSPSRWDRVRPLIGHTISVLVGAAVTAPLLYSLGYEQAQPHGVAAISGKLTCPTGEPVTGVWVAASDKADQGWAAWQPDPASPDVATFAAVVAHSDAFALHVGCGGTPQKWEHEDGTPNLPIGSYPYDAHCTDLPGVKSGACSVQVITDK